METLAWAPGFEHPDPSLLQRKCERKYKGEFTKGMQREYEAIYKVNAKENTKGTAQELQFNYNVTKANAKELQKKIQW